MPEDKWNRVTGFCCGTCMYCSPKNDDTGRCRRHAPTMQGYPVIYLSDDWCGDHKIGTNPHQKAVLKKKSLLDEDRELLLEQKYRVENLLSQPTQKPTLGQPMQDLK